MPDLLGPYPCEGCQKPCTNNDYLGCILRQRWDARRELLEALKAGGWHVDPSNMDYDDWSKIGEAIWESVKAKRGHLIFIPEAQE